MFIYHFSRLIRSKILWSLLALLMVFSFVVADSCSSAMNTMQAAGYIGDASISRKTADDANQTVNLLTGNNVFYLPRQSQLLAYLLRGSLFGELTWQERREMAWRLIAAAQVADANGLTLSENGITEAIMARFADPDGNFNPDYYRAFLSANSYSVPKLFEQTYGTLWFPAEAMTSVVMNATGWVSPMEQEFALSTRFDKTIAHALTLKQTVDPATVTPDDAAVQAWYDAHLKDYDVPETRTIAYVEVPIASFAEKITVEDMDAMQYHDDHRDQFKGKDAEGKEITLPFEEVKDKVVAAVRDERALEEALVYANEVLLPTLTVDTGLAPLAATYGEVKTLELRQDKPVALQKGTDIRTAAFEMDAEYTPFNAIPGTDRVTVIALTKVEAPHTAPLAEVREQVLTAARSAEIEKRKTAAGDTLLSQLTSAMSAGATLEDAVKVIGNADLTLSGALEFTLANDTKIDHPESRAILDAAAELGPQAFSEPILIADGILLVYIDKRIEGDLLAKTTSRQSVVQERATSASFRMASDWLKWNLERCPPTSDAQGELPLLSEGEEDFE